MNDQELVAIINNVKQDAVIYSGDFVSDNEKALKYYLCEPFGDEVSGRSAAISPDVQDIVESDMPSLTRVFLGAGEVVSFESSTDNEEDIQEAKDKTKYVDYLIRKQPDSFKILFDWMKDAEIQQAGVVKYFFEETKETEEHKFKGLYEDEKDAIIDDLDGEDVEEIEEVEKVDNEDSTFDIKFKVTRTKQKISIINVPLESFLISKQATCLDDAEMVGDIVRKTRGQLLAEGYSRDLIDQLPSIDVDVDTRTNLRQIRHNEQGGYMPTTAINDWASEHVDIENIYLLVDYDGDGIAERRNILKAGNKILSNEPFNHVPYALISAVPMPHRAIGRSRADLVMQTQRVKSVLLRQTLDNIYMVNNSRVVVDENTVNIDDLLTVEPNGIVRAEGDPRLAVSPLQIEYIGDRSLQVIQYMDQARAQSTGSLMASQGLEAEDLAKETATRFKGVENAAKAKIELVARVYAETGFRKLYEGVAWLVAQYQTNQTEFRVMGKQMTVDPASWRHNHNVVSHVGLGAGGNEETTQNMAALLQVHNALREQQSPLTDQVKLYNTLAKMLKSMDVPNVSEFINDPEKPEDMIRAENEILNNAVQQLQLQVQQLQNPLAEVERIKQEAALLKAQSDANIDAAKLVEDQRQFNEKMAQDNRQFQAQMVEKLTELELKYGQNVPGAAV